MFFFLPSFFYSPLLFYHYFIFFLSGSMLLSCVCLLLGGVLQLSGGWAVTIFLACFSGASVLGWTVIDVITPELAPTAIR